MKGLIMSDDVKKLLETLINKMDVQSKETRDEIKRIGEKVDRNISEISEVGEKVDRNIKRVDGVNRNIEDVNKNIDDVNKNIDDIKKNWIINLFLKDPIKKSS